MCDILRKDYQQCMNMSMNMIITFTNVVVTWWSKKYTYFVADCEFNII